MAQSDEDAWGPLSEVEKTVSRVDSWNERLARAEQPPETIPDYRSTKRAVLFGAICFSAIAVYYHWEQIVSLYNSVK